MPLPPGLDQSHLEDLLAEAPDDVRFHLSRGAAESFVHTVPLLHPRGYLQVQDIFVADMHEYRQGFRGPGKLDGSGSVDEARDRRTERREVAAGEAVRDGGERGRIEGRTLRQRDREARLQGAEGSAQISARHGRQRVLEAIDQRHAMRPR